MKRKVHVVLKYLLAAGTLGYGFVSAAQSERFAQLTGLQEEEVKGLALRDVVSGIQILTSANARGPLISRAMFDFSDFLKLIRKRPSVAPVALLWGLLALAVLFTQTAPAVESEGAPAPAPARA